jgi:dihydrofolate reductase
LICCIAKNRGIGKNNKLLFAIPDDMKRFKAITMGHPIIMGYKTFQSIGRPLPGRLNIVLSQDDIKISGYTVCHNIEDAIQIASQNDTNEIFFIGGGSVYAQAIKLANKLYLTVVDADADADIYFPDYSQFDIITESKMFCENNIKYKFMELEKNVKK